jgi:hypothetical protein
MIWKLRAQHYRPPKDYKHCYVDPEEDEEGEAEEEKEEVDENESSSSSKVKAIHKTSNSGSKVVVVTNRFVSITGAKRDRGHEKPEESDGDS